MLGELQQVKAAIDTYLGAGSIVPNFDDIIEIYADNIMKFKELKERIDQIVEQYPGVSKEEVNELIDEERKKAIETLKTRLRTEIENKVNSLKASVAEIKQAVVSIPKELATGIAEASMPTMIAPGSPNPASTALRIILNAIAIKNQIDGVLRATSYSIGVINELGLEETPLAESISGIVKPLLSIKQQAESQEKNNEAAAKDYPPSPKTYKTRDPKGNEINGEDIQKKALSYELTFPIEDKKENRKMKKLSKGSDAEKQWVEILNKYDDWLENVKNLKP